MLKRLKAFAYYALFWLAFFITARAFFLIVQYKETLLNKPLDILGTFLHGFKMDMSMTGYILLLPLLFAIPGTFFNGRWYKIFIKYYTYLLIIVVNIIITVDAKLYTYWGFRMDATPLEYLKTPADAMASIDMGLLIFFLVTFIPFTILAIYLFKKLISNVFDDFSRSKYWILSALLFSLLFGAMIIPIRGGFGVATMNAGSVYFSDNLFPNHAAINVIWNAGNSAVYANPETNPYAYGDLTEAGEIVKNLTSSPGETDTIIRPGKPNILLIILESFGSAMTGIQKDDSTITPCFNNMVKDGVFFKNIYASGSRTDKAIPAIFGGYPSLTMSSIIKNPKKTQSLPGLAKLLDKEGYNTTFWYGGDLNFANMNSFIINTGFQKRITMNNFDKKNYNSKWGVHDHVLFKAFFDSLNVKRQPFFNAILSLSSHEPFEVPMKPVFQGNSIVSKFKNSLFYADSVLGGFIEKAKKTSWWENTVVIIIADHCRRNSYEIPLYSEEIFRIPMLWLGGALMKKGITIDKTGSQIDMSYTIASQLGLNDKFLFAKNILASNSKSYAFYTFNEGFVFVTDTSFVAFDHKVGKSVVQRGKNPELTEKYGKAYLQVLFDDYLKR
jgi:phosphoglycerol transferase MdoB-like AlkP superfamily enzyme